MQPPDIHGAIARHMKIAFQLSLGADSLAALYVMKPFWDLLTVYYLDTGDTFPEAQAVLDQVSRDIPITIIYTDALGWREANGLPSDVVPFDNTDIGRGLSGRTIRIVPKLDCCASNILAPMHERMLADGMTLIVRGTRAQEFKGEFPRSGFTDGPVELLHPIEHWTKREVLNYLAEQELPTPPFYAEGMSSVPDCKGCTAWWSEGRLQYLRRHHPEAATEYEKNLRAIRGEILRQMTTCLEELRREPTAL